MRGLTKLDGSIRTRIPSEWEEYLETEAHERSEPGDPVTVSDIVRESLEESYPELPSVDDD
jgi:hypothetical protein